MSGFRIRGLGEVAIRCRDIEAMSAFYEGVLGLARMEGNESPHIRFFRIAEGVAGHTTVLALFEEPEAIPRGALHHIALSLPVEEQAALCAEYDRRGIAWREEIFGWIGWRGIFTCDPEGNTVEVVAYNPDLAEGMPG
ncbi:Glyoxalase/Bleomycin resistance protein/Dioxygenase superfamily protein [Roseivivax lentus]|uniref:Glyoxalase/Bleomycin resistance protein/Dioxygenase superfamily protein n=1 Tax=Roseivivax lentus TaxID=633194 RepID=A0A1N7L5E9_9RHOB|nr:VOC family protein [Roseivivax lentus]SIS69082.1 Glyoxalase/Bleomycin resistance protein/Dioxygenase superfamily protein [Roseivivax lentus]